MFASFTNPKHIPTRTRHPWLQLPFAGAALQRIPGVPGDELRQLFLSWSLCTLIWGNDPIWRAYFQMGWFNHQPVCDCFLFPVYLCSSFFVGSCYLKYCSCYYWSSCSCRSWFKKNHVIVLLLLLLYGPILFLFLFTSFATKAPLAFAVVLVLPVLVIDFTRII